MNPKILVADDSPTIQKVVNITLAGSDYQLETAHDESELFDKLKSSSFDLVLLDFNISEERTGYDLAKSIKESSDTTKVLVMLGTFDTVDDHSMSESGVVDQIVKPFESSLFVEKVKAALEGEASNSVETINLETNESEWVMDNVLSHEQTSEVESIQKNSLSSDGNPLNEMISGWGMSVPSIIGEQENATNLPPQMEVSSAENSLTSGAELIQEIQDNENYEEVTEEEITAEDEPLSKLVSLEELAPDQLIDLEEDIDDTDPQFIIGPSEDSPDLVDALEEDVTPDEFWAADQGSDLSTEETEEAIELIDLGDEEEGFQIDQHVPVNMESESEEIHTPTIQALNDISLNEEVGPKVERVEPSFDYDEIVNRLKSDLKPLILDIVKEVVDQSNTSAAEKVAWEIIPDLAENLIRREVENLSKKVQDKHSLS